MNKAERRTFSIHTIYMILEGIVLGVLALNQFVFIKSLNGTNYQLGFLFQFSALVFLFLIVINEFLKRVKNRKKLLRIVAITTRLPLITLLFFPDNLADILNFAYYHYIFLFLFLVYFSGNIFINPNINYLLKVNYSHVNFGRLYSYSTSVNKIVMLIITFAYGYLLDYNNFAFIYIIPVTAIFATMSVFILSTIHYPEEDIPIQKKSIFASVKASVSEMILILKKNIPYRHFEIGFMFYGFSFMLTMTVITIYFYEALNLNYASVAFYRNISNILVIILLPFFGRLISHIDPRKFAVITFSSITLYIFFLMITSYFPSHFEFLDVTIYYTLLLYILFHGIFAATMVLLWNIGSAYFCKPNEAGTYQSLHLSLTGVRAIFAPLIGVLFYELLGFTPTFSIAIFSLLIAILLMLWSYSRDARIK